MPYAVFALKWRPQTFEEVVGQNHIVNTLKSALQKNRLTHAYLFAGPRGVGKTSTARILAKALNCKDGPTVNPCQKCPSCLEISQGRSLDVIEIDGASNRGIDEIRTLRENVKFSPTAGKFKVYIIDEVHMLTTEAFNALLKTLEEPPDFVKFIFATTQPHKVIPTILSRCQRFDFRRIPAMEIVGQLEKIIAQEQINVDKEVLFTVARSSDGSLRDAETVLDQLVSLSKDNKISLTDVVSMLGLIEQDVLFEITEQIIKKDARAALGLLDNIIDAGKDSGLFLANLIEHFRNLMVVKIAKADSKLIDLPSEFHEKLAQQSGAFTLEEIFSTFNLLVNTQEMAKRLESLRIPLEISLVKLAHDKKTENPNTFTPPKYTTEKNITSKPHIIEKQEATAPSITAGNTVSLDKVRQAWQNIVEALSRVKMSMGTYLNEGSPLKLENNILIVSFPKNYSLHKESLERQENKAIIEKILCELFNVSLRVNFILSKETLVKEDNNENNPSLKSALEAFKARVIRDQ